MLAVLAGSQASPAATSQGYGIRVYSTEHGNKQALVTFPTDNPAEVTEYCDLGDLTIIAAACHNDVYYMVQSEDGLTGSSLMTLDLNTRKIGTVKVWDWKSDLGANLMFTDMTYDQGTGKLFAGAYNLNEAEIIEGVPHAPFSIVTVDTTTGDATLVGSQSEHAMAVIAADDYGLKGIDESGTVWEVSKYSGWPDFEWITIDITPAGQQSMTYDPVNRCWYWSAAYNGDEGELLSELVRIIDNDGDMSYEKLGAIGDNYEITGLYIDPSPLPGGTPSVPADLTVTAAPLGEAKATLAWKNPSVALDGSALESGLGIKIYRNDEPVKTLENCEPGADMQWTDDDITPGMYVYSISAFNAVSEGKRSYTEQTWVGEDVPAMPQNIKAVKSDDGESIRVSWEAPAAGMHGGWFDADGISYTLVRYPDAKVLSDNGSAMEYTDNDVSEMHGYYYEVTPATGAGEGAKGKSDIVVTGKPHTVPYEPDFNQQDTANQWISFNNDGDDYGWYTDSGWAGTNDVFFRYYPEATLNAAEEADEWLVSPPVQLDPAKYYAVEYDVRLLGELFPANTLLAIGTSQDFTAMTKTLETNEAETNDIEWIRHSVPFKVDNEGSYCFGYHVGNRVPVQFYKFRVIEVPQHDLAADGIKGDAIIGVNKAAEYSVGITNNGFYDADSYVVRLVDANDEVVAETAVDTPLPARSSTTVTVTLTPVAEGSMSITPVVIAENDEIPANDKGNGIDLTVIDASATVTIAVEPITGTPSAPVYSLYNHSAVQTIYTNDLFELNDGAAIKGLTYYISNLMGGLKTDYTMDLKLCVGEVDKDDYVDETMLPESDFTPVYDGEITIPANTTTMTVVFENPVVYHGGNLCIFTRHSSTKATPVMFEGSLPGTSTPYHSCLYTGNADPFDFTQSVRGSKELPKVTLLVNDGTGTDRITIDQTARPVYDRAAHRLLFGSECREVSIHTLTGIKTATFRDVREVSVAGMPQGPVVVEVTTETGRKSFKIML